MKTQLIQLDPYDDTISVRDKMGWSQTGRILLIWPEQGKILSRELDLVLLQRHSISLGAQLALVTSDPQVREISSAIGLPVFKNTRQAQNTRWRSTRHRRKHFQHTKPSFTKIDRPNIFRNTSKSWQEHPVVRYGLFGISVFSVFTLVLLFIPDASLRIKPETRQQSINIPVSSSQDYSDVRLTGELPAQIITVVVEGRDSQQSTGNMMIPVDSAVGALVFTNLTDRAIVIPAGQVVSSLDAQPIRFSTTQAGRLAAGPGRTITLPAVALVPGESGNLPAGNLVAVEGDLGLSLAATNPYPTHGGRSAQSPAPSQADRSRLLSQLMSALEETALSDLQLKLPEESFLITTSLQLANVMEEVYTPPQDFPGDSLDLTLRLEYQALYISDSTLQTFLVPILDGSVPEGYTPLPDTFSFIHSSPIPDDNQDIYHWTITASRQLQADIPGSEVITLSLGQPSATVIYRLATVLPLDGLPELTLHPSWWPRMPFLPFRIEVIAP